jgi:hypothetical protein
MTGVELIAAERKRQFIKEGWTAEHDDGHSDGELAMAAACYAAAPNKILVQWAGLHFEDAWPWERRWDKRPRHRQSQKLKVPTHRQRLRMLAKAGALIAAEIDRLQRQSRSQ